MNRVIHINFQGSVIPIEETAADLLRRYIADLRNYFVKEEGRDEIISDIESRIAELFLERIKKGAACISDQDMREIMAGIGMPEDLEAAEQEAGDQSKERVYTEHRYQSDPNKARLFRAANDQIWGGVAAGIAYHFKIDPAIVRVLFVFSMFAGFGLPVYLVLWAVLPKENIGSFPKSQRRLFRNMEERKIGGVAAGIAAYLDVAVWIPRVIFLAPLLLSILDNRLDFFHGFSNFVFPGFSGTLFLLYIVLWAVVPAANTAAEKLQMRGEKVDLTSIQKTVNEELGQLKQRAERWGKEAGKRFQDKAKEMQEDLSGPSQEFSAKLRENGRRGGKGLAYGLGMFLKGIGFVLLFGLAITLLVSFGGLFTGLAAGHQLVDYILINDTEKNLLWAVLILMVGVPAIGLLTWLVKAMRGIPGNRYTGYAFSGLHIIGWGCLIFLIILVSKHFQSKARETENIVLQQPSQKKLYLRVVNSDRDEEIIDWKHESRWPRLNHTEDTVFAKNIRIKVVQSSDSQFHARLVRMANGMTLAAARTHAAAIQFPIVQQDTVLMLPKYLRYPKQDKFYVQQALLIVEVPDGAKIIPDGKIREYDWSEIRINTGTGFSFEEHESDDERDWKWDAENEVDEKDGEEEN